LVETPSSSFGLSVPPSEMLPLSAPVRPLQS
jgi:hypothetical protein